MAWLAVRRDALSRCIRPRATPAILARSTIRERPSTAGGELVDTQIGLRADGPWIVVSGPSRLLSVSIAWRAWRVWPSILNRYPRSGSPWCGAKLQNSFIQANPSGPRIRPGARFRRPRELRERPRGLTVSLATSAARASDLNVGITRRPRVGFPCRGPHAIAVIILTTFLPSAPTGWWATSPSFRARAQALNSRHTPSGSRN